MILRCVNSVSVWLAALLLVVVDVRVGAHPALNTRADAASLGTWQAPGPNDSRGPCPGLNTLANQGLLPRSGRAITLTQAITSAKTGLNVGADFMTIAFAAGLLSNPDLLATTFDLGQLSKHNWFIEHDASMTREDAGLGDQTKLNQRAYQMFMGFFNGRDRTSIETASKAKLARVQDQRARNPGFTYGPREFVLSYMETSLLLQTMSDTSSGAAPIPYVRTFLEQERLPVKEGWRPSPSEINLLTLGGMAARLQFASGEAVPEGANVTFESPQLVFQALGPLGGKIEDAVGRLGVKLPLGLGG